MTNKNKRIVGAILMVLALIETQSGYAQSPAQNYGVVKGTIGATAAMYGAAAAAGVCTLTTMGLCGAAIGVTALGLTAATVNMFPTPPVMPPGPDPSQMPDGIGGASGDDGCGGDGSIAAEGVFDEEGFNCGN